MTLQEFTKLTGLNPTEAYYHNVIEKDYMNSTLEKQDWCANWVEKGGIQKAYEYLKKELSNVQKSSAEEIKQLEEVVDKLQKENTELEDKIIELNKSQEDVKKIKEEYDMFKFKVSKFFISRGVSLLSDFLTFKTYEN